MRLRKRPRARRWRPDRSAIGLARAVQVAALSSSDGNYADLSIRHTRALGSLEVHKKECSRLKAELGALQLHHAQQTAMLELRRETVTLALDKTNKALRATSTALEQVNAASKVERAALVDAALSSLRQLRTHLTQAVRSNMPDGSAAPRESAADGEDVAYGILEVRSLTNESDAAALTGAGAGGSARAASVPPAPPAKRVSPIKTQITAMATWRPEQGVPWPSWYRSTDCACEPIQTALPSLVLCGVSDAAEQAPASARSTASVPLGRAPHHGPHPPISTSPIRAAQGSAWRSDPYKRA